MFQNHCTELFLKFLSRTNSTEVSYTKLFYFGLDDPLKRFVRNVPDKVSNPALKAMDFKTLSDKTMEVRSELLDENM